MLKEISALSLTLCALLVVLTACGKASGEAPSPSAGSAKVMHAQVYSDSNLPDFNTDIMYQATIYKTTPSKIALAMMICKFDKSYIYTDLVKMPPQELFDTVSAAAVENDVTLESLDQKYALSEILRDENIFISITANNVTSAAAQSSQKDSQKDSQKVSSKNSSSQQRPVWIVKFEKAIRTN